MESNKKILYSVSTGREVPGNCKRQHIRFLKIENYQEINPEKLCITISNPSVLHDLPIWQTTVKTPFLA